MTNIFKEILRITIRSKVTLFALVLFMSFLCSLANSNAAITPESLQQCISNKKIDKDEDAMDTSDQKQLACIQNASIAKCGYNLLPIQGFENHATNIASTTGTRWRDEKDSNGKKTGKKYKDYHYGLDVGVGYGIVSRAGPPIMAARDAYKVETRPCMGGGGNTVFLYHKYDADPNDAVKLKKEGPIAPAGTKKCFCTVYMHLNKFTMQEKGNMTGVVVQKGEQLGLMGGTGSGCALQYSVHMHIELKACDATGSCSSTRSAGYSADPFCDGLCGDGLLTKDCAICKTNPSAAVCKPAQTDFKANSIVGTHNNIDVPEMQNRPRSTQNSGGTSEKCSISNYRNSVTGCLFCQLFENIFNTASLIAGKAFKILAPSVLLLVLVGTAVWISFSLVKNLSSFEVKEPRRMLKEILNKLFVVLIVVVLLKSDPYIVFSLTIEPVFNTGTKLAQLIAGTPSCSTSDFDIVSMGLSAQGSGGGLPQSMGLSILCTVKAVQDQILDIMSLGSTLLCIGFFEKAENGIPLFPHFGFAISGLVLWIGAILLMVIYPWLLIDTVLKLAVVTALIPAGIGGFAFKSTKKYIGIIWNSFMSTIFNFIFLTIIIFIITTMISNIVSKAFQEITNLGEVNSFDKLLSNFGIWGTHFLQLAFVIILGWAVLGEGSELSGKFSEVWGSGSASFNQNIGSNVGTTTMSGVKGAATPVAKGAISFGKFTLKNAGEGLRSVGNRISFNRSAKKIENKAGGNVDADGNATYSYKNWRGKNITKTLSTDAYGNQKITQTKTSKNKTVTTERDKFMTTKTLKDNKTGKVIGQETSMNTAFMKSLLNSNGSINQIAINSFMQNSMHDQQTKMIGIMNQINKERFGDSTNVSSTFSSRNVAMGTDENGNTTFSLTQTLGNGTTQKFNMSLSDKRAKTSFETIGSNGKSFTMESDGIINKTRQRRYDKNGEIMKKYESTRYSISSYYDKIPGRSLNSLGEFGSHIPQDEIMFGEGDLAAFTSQVTNYGDPEVDTSFIK